MPETCELRNGSLSIAVSPMGAEMQYLRTTAGDDILWHGDAAFWTGRAPILFPIVGRAPDDTIAIGDHVTEMKQHGFARRSLFRVETQTETMCSHILTDTDATRTTYPCPFALRVVHRIDGNTLHVTAEVTNTGTGDLPFGVGFHPAFAWPLPNTGNAPHHVTFASDHTPEMRALEDGLLLAAPMPSVFEQGTLEVTEELFKNDALVMPNGTAPLRYGVADGPSLAFTFDNLPDLALWRPMGAPFLCVEPWHGTAPYVGDGPQIADRPNSITLAAGKTTKVGYTVTVNV